MVGEIGMLREWFFKIRWYRNIVEGGSEVERVWGGRFGFRNVVFRVLFIKRMF